MSSCRQRQAAPGPQLLAAGSWTTWLGPLCRGTYSRLYKVDRKYLGMDTAFRATLPNAAGTGKGPTIAICCEYDALPGIGHACGHNLICEAGLAAALGVKAACPLLVLCLC